MNNQTNILVIILELLASLKIAVASFGLALFLIYVGTLAQVEHEIWKVMEDYFTSWAVDVPAEILFPASWFPNRYLTELTPKKGAELLPIIFTQASPIMSLDLYPSIIHEGDLSPDATPSGRLK